MVELHLLPKGEDVLEIPAGLHRAELQSLTGVFPIPQINLQR